MTLSRRHMIGGSVAAGIAGVLAGKSTRDQRVSLLDFIPPDEQAAIAAGTSGYDCAADVQRAIEAASARDRTLVVPPGVYQLRPALQLAAEDRSFITRAALRLRSGMRIEALDGAVFRIADGMSSAESPFPMALFGADAALADVSIAGLAMDMNGARNPISRVRAPGEFRLFNQAHIYVSGGSVEGAARIDGCVIERCRFLDTPGTSCIVMAQSNTPGAALGRGWIVRNCEFRNNGLDTDDHSSIYGWAEDVFIHNCRFDNDRGFGPPGGNTACEIHGSNSRFVGNLVRRYFQGVWIAENYTRSAEGILIEGNSFEEMKGFGISFFGRTDAAKPARRVVIRDNDFSFDDRRHPGLDLKAAVSIASPNAQSDIEISRNRTKSANTRSAVAGVAVAASRSPGEKHSRIIIRENHVEGATFGEYLKTNAAAGLGEIEIRGNSRINLTPAGPFELPMGLCVSFDGSPSPIERLTITGNSCVDTRADPLCAFAVYLSGSIGVLDYAPGEVRGMAVANYREARLDVRQRRT